MPAALSPYQLWHNARLNTCMEGVETLEVNLNMVYLVMALVIDGAYNFIAYY